MLIEYAKKWSDILLKTLKLFKYWADITFYDIITIKGSIIINDIIFGILLCIRIPFIFIMILVVILTLTIAKIFMSEKGWNELITSRNAEFDNMYKQFLNNYQEDLDFLTKRD